MAKTAEMLIVGGGCIGASIAYHLARSRAGQVTLLERATLGSGTTGQSSAIVRQHYSIPTLALMAQRSLRVFERFDEQVGGEAGFRRTGLLIGARAEDVEGLRATVAMQREHGIDSRMIDVAELHVLEPRMVTSDLLAACYEPEAGYADPIATTMAYARGAREGGAAILEQTPVAALWVERDRVRGVRLADGTAVEAETVIVAAGIWGVRLLGAAGIDLPVRPTRHPCILLRPPVDFGPPPPILFDFSNGLYLKPEGGMILAGTLEESEADRVDPDRYNGMPSNDEQERFAARTARRFPALEDATLQSGWAGLYDVSADWQPIIGETAIGGLFCAVGFSGHGFKLCPVVGEMVRDMVLRRPTPGIDSGMFRPDRFTMGALAESRYAYGIIG